MHTAGIPPPTPFFKGVPKLREMTQSYTSTKTENKAVNVKRRNETKRLQSQNRKKHNQKYSESKVNEKGRGESSSECDSSDSEGGEVWVQCENSDCRKWRKLPQESTSIDLAQ